jgi:hypothetical protein
MPQVYRYKRTHVYYYEVVANDVKTANEQVRKVWAGSYKDMKLSDYELVKTSKFEAKPVITAEPEVEVEPEVETKAVVKKAAKKVAKKAAKKTAKKAKTKKHK